MMIHALTGGAWGEILQPVFSAMLTTVPLMAVLFVPLALVADDVYPWVEPSTGGTASAAPPAIAAYLNLEDWRARAGLYFVLWTVCALLLRRWSQAADPALAARQARWRYRLSGPALLIFAVSMEFASTDWSMSIDPYWYSSMYGIATMAGQVCSALALAIVLAAWAFPDGPWHERLTRGNCRDLGSLLFTAVLFWTYAEFMQYLIIYSGDLPIEVRWYVSRSEGPWLLESRLIALLHFAVPFGLLLFRPIKEDRGRLARVALLLVVMQWVEWHWLVVPAVSPQAFELPWTALAATATIGGAWISLFCRELEGQLGRTEPTWSRA